MSAYLGLGKMWRWCSCSTKRDIKNRRYLGHWVAESNEDRLLASLPSDSAAVKCGMERMELGLSGYATWGKSLYLSGLQSC